MNSALAVIRYKKKLQPAMEYAFGGVLICKDLDMANRLAFHERIQKKCVTLEGVVVDPNGDVTDPDGDVIDPDGDVLDQYDVSEIVAHPLRGPILNIVKELMAREEKLKKTDGELKEIESRIEKVRNLKLEVDMKQFQLELTKKEQKFTSYYMLKKDVRISKQRIGRFL